MPAIKLTRSQKCYGTALAIGLIALAVDRLTAAATPVEADAASVILVQDTPTVTVPVGHPVADPATASFDLNLAGRLAELRSFGTHDGTARDGFRPSAHWSPGAPVKKADTVDHVAIFVQAHTLKAVIRGGGAVQAMVDNSLVAVGQAFDGFVLVSAGDMQATFRNGRSHGPAEPRRFR